jgi:hypothetical protein
MSRGLHSQERCRISRGAQHAYTLCDGAQDPVTTIAGNSGRFGNFATPTEIISVQQTQPHTKCRRLDLLDQDVYGIEIEKRLERHVGENDEGK